MLITELNSATTNTDTQNVKRLQLSEEEKRLRRNEQSKACRLRKKMREESTTIPKIKKIATSKLSDEEKRLRRNAQSKACRLRKKQLVNSNNKVETTTVTNTTINLIENPTSILVGRTNNQMDTEAMASSTDTEIPEIIDFIGNDTIVYEKEFLKRTGKDFNHFYKTYYPKLNWYIMRIVNNSDAAEDLVNIAFMQSLKKIHTYLPEYSYSTWLFNIAQRLAFTYLKDIKKMPTSSIDEQDEDGNSIKQHLESTLEHTEPEDNTKTMLKYEYMMKQIDELPEKYRIIITLREIDGLTYKEIDEVLHIGEQNVKNRIHNGRLLLQKKVESYFKMIEETM